MIFEPDRIFTILSALDIYEKQALPSIVPEQYEEELARVTEIKNFLNLILEKEEKIEEILEKYLIQDNEDACSWNINEVDYEKLEKELQEYIEV